MGRGEHPDWKPLRPRRLALPPVVASFLLIAAVLAGAVGWLVATRLQAATLVAYLAGVNVATLAAYAYDKAVAGGSLWRVPEGVLRLLALAGGSPAALAGQRVLRHKTRKTRFQVWFWVIVAAQAAAVGAWLWRGGVSQPRQFSSRMILSVSRYASSTHSTILAGSGEYSSSMLAVRLKPVSRMARR